MTGKKIEQLFNIAYVVIASFSLLENLLLIFYYFYLSSIFGYSPSYGNPDYTQYSQNSMLITLNTIIVLLFIISLWCTVYIFPVIFTGHLVLKFTKKTPLNFKVAIAGFICSASIFLIPLIPGIADTLSWILD